VTLHPTALIEDDVVIGERTAVWCHVHLRAGARIGADCIIGEKTYLAGGVVVGDRVKINAMAYVCEGVTLGDGVMVSAGVIFTNDRYPRAATNDLARLRPSEAGDDTLPTQVHRGATIGAGAVVGPGLEIGEFAMVGMGSVVTRSVPAHALVVGNPARIQAWVCRCGTPLFRHAIGAAPTPGTRVCPQCGWSAGFDGSDLSVTAPT
jgi:acetyltransferase-like isoleucine patch superfamily enzyme